MHELDRLDYEVITANESMGFSGSGVISVRINHEVEKKSSSFLSLFSGGEIEKVKKQVTLIVSEESHDSTRISIENEQGEVEDSTEAIEFLTQLYNQLR